MIPGIAILDGMGASGIIPGDAPKSTAVAAGGVGSIKQPKLGGLLIEPVQRNPRLYGSSLLVGIDFDYLVQVFAEIQDKPFTKGFSG